MDNRSDGLNIDITISPNDSCYVDKAHAAALMNSFSENSDDIKLDVNRIARRGSYNNSLTPSTHCKGIIHITINFFHLHIRLCM